jgi:hypothetical protein
MPNEMRKWLWMVNCKKKWGRKQSWLVSKYCRSIYLKGLKKRMRNFRIVSALFKIQTVILSDTEVHPTPLELTCSSTVLCFVQKDAVRKCRIICYKVSICDDSESKHKNFILKTLLYIILFLVLTITPFANNVVCRLFNLWLLFSRTETCLSDKLWWQWMKAVGVNKD